HCTFELVNAEDTFAEVWYPSAKIYINAAIVIDSIRANNACEASKSGRPVTARLQIEPIILPVV
ncbi:MAG: hypothetical protein WBH50_21095, partial [Fuerstiella sp.]